MTDPAEYLRMPYHRIIVPEEDGSYRGQILEFPGCLTLAGSAIAALQSIEVVAESWIESALAQGQSIPEPIENVWSGAGTRLWRVRAQPMTDKQP